MNEHINSVFECRISTCNRVFVLSGSGTFTEVKGLSASSSTECCKLINVTQDQFGLMRFWQWSAD